MSDAATPRWMRWSVAFVWLWTGVGVLHPYYREKGEFYLAPLGLPSWVMWVTCAGEVALAVWVALRKSETWLTALQVATILAFTVILSFSHPELWLDPESVLTKNLPLIGLIVAAWLLEREKKSPRVAYFVLGFSLLGYWLAVAVTLFLMPDAQVAQVFILDLCELLSISLLLAGFRMMPVKALPPLGCLLLVPVVALTLVVSLQEPLLWFHPFGPLSKNLAIIGASMILVGLARGVQDWPRKQRGLSA